MKWVTDRKIRVVSSKQLEKRLGCPYTRSKTAKYGADMLFRFDKFRQLG